MDGTIYTQIVRPPLSSGQVPGSVDSSLLLTIPSFRDTSLALLADVIQCVLVSGSASCCWLLSLTQFSSQRKHSSGVESYGLDSTSISGLLPLTDLSSGIAFISIYTPHCPILGAKCSTLYVQRSGKSVELRLSVPGSWAVIVVELWGSVANKHTGLLKNDSLYSKTHHSLNSKYTVNRLDSVSTWIESELNQNEIKLMNPLW